MDPLEQKKVELEQTEVMDAGAAIINEHVEEIQATVEAEKPDNINIFIGQS
jgi:hypothetical protein